MATSSSVEEVAPESPESSGTAPKRLKKTSKRRTSCPPDGNLLPPCRVCGDKASGFHYGVNSCEACKGFFWRCLRKIKQGEEFYCSKGCHCTMTELRSCTYCRYNKCLEVGMSQDAIKIGRYTFKKRVRDKTELKKIQDKESNLKTEMRDKETSTSRNETECAYIASGADFSETVHIDTSRYNNQSPKHITNDQVYSTVENANDGFEINQSNPLTTNEHQSEPIDLSSRRFRYPIEDQYYVDKIERNSFRTNITAHQNEYDSDEQTDTTGYQNDFDSNEQTDTTGYQNDFDSNEQTDITGYQNDFDWTVDKLLSVNIGETETSLLINKLVEIQGNEIEFLISFDKKLMLQKQQEIYESHRKKQEMFGSMQHIPKHMYQELYNSTGIDVDNRQMYMKFVATRMENLVRVMVKFAKALPGFGDLMQSDQVELIKACYHEYWYLHVHRRINTELRVFVYSVEGPFVGLHQDAFSMFNDDKSSQLDMIFQCAEQMQNFDLTLQETTLYRGIVLTSTDGRDLKEPEKAIKVHRCLVEALRWFVQQNYNYPEERMKQIFESLEVLKKAAKAASEIDNLKAQWEVMKSHPLVLEIMEPY